MNSDRLPKISFCLILYALPAICFSPSSVGQENQPLGQPWQCHIIDNSSQGADGVKLADINGDGLIDITTGWEEGGLTRVYLHPGHDRVKANWPAVTIGNTPAVEDAVFADLDNDGADDVISCCEGNQQSIFVHWSPKQSKNLLDPQAWHQEVIPSSVGKMKWMYAWPMQVDQRHGIDIIAGGKNKNSEIGWYEAPANSRDLDAYQWHTISPAGWIMSIWKSDMDADGDLDLVISDRYGDLHGCRWLQNPGPGPEQSKPWPNHYMGTGDHEVLSMTLADWDNDGLEDALVAVKDFKVLFLKRLDTTGKHWQTHKIPANFNAGNTRAVAVADINLDGRDDLAITTWIADKLHGVLWLEAPRKGNSNQWQPHQISGNKKGIKYDRIEMLDLDADGDLDLLTCEEREGGSGLGVIWYENPHAK